ncbi:PREDICTED: keratin, type I cytoskeletal 18-like [Cercocebus atys]|uniref:keratin, type I cytoskeletal 18-like n=1 Tax=Cercocebus atys TaxID=9531 RepID=UPI0005F54714|nr:PREDICTED: keratin, type I cytoskeletal 18-like [Cercocebus atys]
MNVDLRKLDLEEKLRSVPRVVQPTFSTTIHVSYSCQLERYSQGVPQILQSFGTNSWDVSLSYPIQVLYPPFSPLKQEASSLSPSKRSFGRSPAKSKSCPLAIYPRQHELHHLLHLLHQLPVPRLCPGTQLDAPKSQDLTKIMADIRAQYDQLAQKNREELDKYWSQQIEESTTVVTTQSTEVGAAKTTLTELRCTVQFLEIELDSMRNLKASLENSLREVVARYALQMEYLNGILLHLESELAQTRAEGQCQAQDYKALLNIKVRLEAEIATYLKDFNLGDALDSSNFMQTIQKTTTRQIVDGKVVSETNDTKILRI